MLQQILHLALLATAAAQCSNSCYRVPSRYWSGNRTRDLILNGDTKSQNTNAQMLQCLMQLSRKWQLGRDECAVFQAGSASPCFIGTLKAHFCENLQPVTANTSNGVHVWVKSLIRDANCTMIQHRVSSSISFYRNWTDYANGFGEGPSGNFWIGLEKMHNLTNSKPSKLYMEMMMWNGSTYWASYSSFLVGPASDQYRLNSLGAFQSRNNELGDCMSLHIGMRFSTYDADFDIFINNSCSVMYRGAWWYQVCHWTNPNGVFYNPPEALQTSAVATGIVWKLPFGYTFSMKEFKMMLW